MSANKDTGEVFDLYYDYAKRGAPENYRWSTGLQKPQSPALALVDMAVTYHRDKVNDIKAEIDRFILGGSAVAPEVKKLLGDLSNICTRID